MVKSIYPNESWNSEHFGKSSYFKDTKNQRKFLVQLANKLNIKSQEDWYKVTYNVSTYYHSENFLRIFNIYRISVKMVEMHYYKSIKNHI